MEDTVQVLSDISCGKLIDPHEYSLLVYAFKLYKPFQCGCKCCGLSAVRPSVTNRKSFRKRAQLKLILIEQLFCSMQLLLNKDTFRH